MRHIPIPFWLQRSAILLIGIVLVAAPLAPALSAPTPKAEISNLGLLAVGGTVTASSSTSLLPSQAFDGLLYSTSKASSYENGWVSRTGAGSWIERQWPGSTSISGIIITRRVNRTISLCSKAKDIDVTIGDDTVVPITLADTNAPQFFPITVGSTKLIRLTVRSTEGTNCISGNVGFGEIEIYGIPKNWTSATPATAAATSATTTLVPPNTLSFVYDVSIPQDAQADLNAYFAAVIPVLTEVLGPPLASQTITVKLSPSFGSFTYSAAFSTITLSRLPNTTVTPNDPANWDFNSNLTHELAHAYQYSYGSAAPAWFREGFAQASADLVKQVLAERGAPWLQNNTIDEGASLRTYDSVAAMGPEVLSNLWDGNSRFIPYANAEGMWWLLLLSQSSPRINGSFGELDFFKRVEASLYQRNPSNSFADRRTFLASISPNPIDGIPVSQWIARQPIAEDATYQTALGFYPGDCFCASNAAAEANHLYIIFQTIGGPMNGSPIHIVVRDASGTIISDETKTYTDFGFGFFYYTLPTFVDLLPAGRYDITVEASYNGAILRATQSIARGSYSFRASDGVGLYRRLASPSAPITLITSPGSFSPASAENGILGNLSGVLPQDLTVAVNGSSVLGRIFLPAPYTRFVNLP